MALSGREFWWTRRCLIRSAAWLTSSATGVADCVSVAPCQLQSPEACVHRSMPAYCVSGRLQRLVVALVVVVFIWHQPEEQLLERLVHALPSVGHGPLMGAFLSGCYRSLLFFWPV